jgi:hypothetical protein
MIVASNGIHELADFRPTGGNTNMVYGRTIQYDESSFAEVRISFSQKFGKMIITLLKINEPRSFEDGQQQYEA